jgi:hypothetical protein
MIFSYFSKTQIIIFCEDNNGVYAPTIASKLEKDTKYKDRVEVFKGRDSGKKYGVFKDHAAGLDYIDMTNHLIHTNGLRFPKEFIKFDKKIDDARRVELFVRDLAVMEWSEKSKMYINADLPQERRKREKPIMPRNKEDGSHCDIFNAFGCIIYNARERGKYLKFN